MTRITLVVLALAAVTLAGCRGETPATAAPQKPGGAAAKPREVRVVPAAEERVARVVVATGTLAADDQTVLGLKVAGRLAEIPVDLGSPVRRGQVVARLDPTDFRLQVEQAEAALQQARARLGLPLEGTGDRIDPAETALVRQARAVLEEARLTRDRMVKLWERELIARAQLDTAIASLGVAEGRYQEAIEEVRNRQAIVVQRRSELEIARQQAADAVLVSPIDGAVRERHASVGQYLAAGAPVVTVVSLHPLRLRLAVPERDAAAVRVGQSVRVTVEGDPTAHGGRVARLSPAIQEQTRTLMLEAEVGNERGALRPGAFARAEIVTAAGERIVTVPASAVIVFAGLEKVLVVRDGRTLEQRVQTARRDGGRVEIASGLTAGELVVAEPGNLTGGQTVTVVR
ncbi:MAG: efflux RND transporter periplasmic adaptor subunit [Candidatus Rokubacteria bacterium]|nr:efflux RND transporter periplasmic adaptor subunit [Candidatus Rokubacteria bacterium]